MAAIGVLKAADSPAAAPHAVAAIRSRDVAPSRPARAEAAAPLA